MIFLFEFNSININMMFEASDIDDIFFQNDEDTVVADAEKAFIKLMDTKYNEVKYINYPEGVDGLFDTGLHRYGYTINENVVFKTNVVQFSGAHGLAEKKDVLLVEGKEVKIIQGYHS